VCHNLLQGRTQNQPLLAVNTRFINLLLSVLLMTGLSRILVATAAGQNFTTLYRFSLADANGLNSDGRNPFGGLNISGSTLSGTTASGGYYGNGTVFIIDTNGTGFLSAHSFTASALDYNESSPAYFAVTNGEGTFPQAGLTISGTALFGTTRNGGTNGSGTIFSLSQSAGVSTVHAFTPTVFIPGQTDTDYYTNYEGANPSCDLVVSGTTLYGVAQKGGYSSGTVFKMNTDGTGVTTLHSFSLLTSETINRNGLVQYLETNTDGASPISGLVLSGDTLYGTTPDGGTAGDGTIFAVNTDGSGFTNIYNFQGAPFDGQNPQAKLLLSGQRLYGTCFFGGPNGNGSIFAIDTNGSNYMVLHFFSTGTNDQSFSPYNNHTYTNLDGANPAAGLIVNAGTLLGTTSEGGTAGNGTVFALNTDGAAFQVLHTFSYVNTNSGGVFTNSDGANPQAPLLSSGGVLYGTAAYGGLGDGTLFSLPLPGPPLHILRAGANLIVSWATNQTGFVLQSATNLVSPVAWQSTSPAPAVFDGQYTVTNGISGTQKFYRLSQ